jgi:uncharacterized repeat protein (TIGR01451 family)
VTHVRHYSGSKVSIWTDGGVLLASQEVDSVLGKWVETPLTTPVQLLAGNRYRVAFYTGGQNYFWNTPSSSTFPHGSIIQGYFASGNAFPTNVSGTKWYLVDLAYTVGTPVSVSPATSGTFVNGVWTGNITVQEPSANMALTAKDSGGHDGACNVFSTLIAADMSVDMLAGPNPVTVGSNLTYTINVLNSGPSAATSVNLTDTLPIDANFVSVATSQGSCTNSGGQVTCNLGTLTSLNAATLTIVVNPIIAGSQLTNTVVVTRGEADADLGNNSATSITTASDSLSILLGMAVDMPNFTWQTGGDGLWFNQTNVTHDGIEAAQSGTITHSKQTWMESKVNGPLTVSFWWKVSSELSFDGIIFYTNGVSATSRSGEGDWQQKTFNLPAGLNTLRWTYAKNSSGTSGSDAAWVDEIAFDFPPFMLVSPVALTNGQFQFDLVGTNGQSLIVEASTNLTTWEPISTNVLSGSSMTITDMDATNHLNRNYRAVFQP